MPLARQLNQFSFKSRLKAGSSKNKGHLKEERPLESNKPLHLILKSEKAIYELSFLRRAKGLRQFVFQKAKDCGVVIMDYANAGNHIHLVLRFKKREEFQRFFRIIAGVIPRRLLKAQKGRPAEGRFWTGTALTRIVNWGCDLEGLKKYFELNRIEVALGISRPSARLLMTNIEKGFSPWADA